MKAFMIGIIICGLFSIILGSRGLVFSEETVALSSSSKRLPRKWQIKKVPYILQKDGYCGPASLAMILNYYDHRITQRSLGNMGVRARGILDRQIIQLAKERGFKAEYIHGDFDKVKRQLARNRPLYVGIKRKKHSRYGHAIVVYGYNDISKSIYYHNPAGGKKLKMTYRDFLKYWEAGGKWAVLITPGEDSDLPRGKPVYVGEKKTEE